MRLIDKLVSLDSACMHAWAGSVCPGKYPQHKAERRQGRAPHEEKGGLGGVARGVSGSQMGQPDGEQCGLTCGMPKQRFLARIARRGGRKGTCDAPWRAPDSHKGLGAIAGVFAEPPGTDREGARGPERGWRRRDHTTFIARGHDLRLNRGVLWHQSQGQPDAWGLGTGQVGDHGVRGVRIAKGRCRGTGRELRARDGDEGNV